MKNLDVAVKYITFLALMIVVLSVLGILSYNSNSKKIVSASNRTSSNVSTQVEPNDQYRLGLTFVGDNDQMFDLRQGIVEFETTYSGEGKFTARILRTDGTELFTLAEKEGSFKEKKSFNVPETGVYILSVKCSGEWSVLRR